MSGLGQSSRFIELGGWWCHFPTEGNLKEDQLDVSLRQASRDVEQAAGYLRLELKQVTRARDDNVSVIGLWSQIRRPQERF